MPSNIEGNHNFSGVVSFSGKMFPPPEAVDNLSISSNANQRIDANKVKHQFPINAELFAPGVTIVAVPARLLHICRAAGKIVGIEAAITTQATGADRTVTVDLHKSTGAGAFATALTTNCVITNTTSVRTPVPGVVNTAASDTLDNDLLQLVVTVAGSAGAQAQGLVVTVTIWEQPA